MDLRMHHFHDTSKDQIEHIQDCDDSSKKSLKDSLSKKHIIIAYFITSVLFVSVSFFVYYMNNLVDETMSRQPRELSKFIGRSITLKIFNLTNDTFVLNKITFPKDSYINYRYYADAKKLYIESSKNLKFNAPNDILSHVDLNEFLNIKIPPCTINRDFFDSIKDFFNPNTEDGLSIVLESKEDQSSIKFDIINTGEGYTMQVLQTSDNYIELAPHNIHNGIDVFDCTFDKNSKFPIEINKFIKNGINTRKGIKKCTNKKQ